MSANQYRQRYIKVGSRNIRYVSEGEGDAVILIHSLGGSLDWWDLTIPALSSNLCVYAIDIPGFGMSDPLNEEVSTNFATAFMVEFMDKVNIKKASLIGHSMGGYIALRTALDNGSMVDKLVLVASAGLGRIHHPILRALSLPIIGDIAATPTMLGVRIFIKSLVYNKKFASNERIETAYCYLKRPKAKQDFLRALRGRGTLAHEGGNMFTSSELRKLDVPTMLIWGIQDSVFPVSQAESAAVLIPNAQLHTFDKCRHIPQIEHAAEFNDIVHKFLLEFR